MERPRRLGSDNGSPFNSKEFSEFAKQEEFKNDRMTSLHPRANGKVESFMENLNKTEQIASVRGKNRLERRNAVQDMLIAYRLALHPATEFAPYEALKGTPVRTKLDYTKPEHREMRRLTSQTKESQNKSRKRSNSEKGNQTRENNLLLGDNVFLKQPRKSKWSTPHELVFYVVCGIRGLK